MRAKVCCSGIVLVLIAGSAGWATTVTVLDEIAFWTGTGDNRAAVVIDWDDSGTDDEALVWGYRWTGVATGEQMLRTVVEADARLFARLGTSAGSLGAPVYGLGYDLSNDSVFGISDGTNFDALGIAVTGIPDSPPQLPATSIDVADTYAEGWFTGFWNYSVSDDDPFDGGSWSGGGSGASGRELADSDWDGWTFSATFDFSAFPNNPHAAQAPLTADFDTDADVDAGDFLIWQRGYGILEHASPSQGDATGDGAVDEVDLQEWSAQFGTIGAAGTSLVSAPSTVPEPTCCTLALGVCFFFDLRFTSRRRI